MSDFTVRTCARCHRQIRCEAELGRVEETRSALGFKKTVYICADCAGKEHAQEQEKKAEDMRQAQQPAPAPQQERPAPAPGDTPQIDFNWLDQPAPAAGESDTVRAFREVLTKVGLKVAGEQRHGEDTVFFLNFSGDVTQYQMVFNFRDHDRTFAILVPHLVRVPIDKRCEILEKLNEMNRDYRFIRMFVNSEDDVMIQIDREITSESVGSATVGAVAIVGRVVSKVYPELMRIIWSE